MRRVSWLTCIALIACKKDPDVVPGELSVSPTELDFQTVGVGSEASLDVTLTNGGGAEVGLLSVTLVNGDPDVFSVTRDLDAVPAGGSVALTVTFTPEQEEAYSGLLQIRTDDEDAANIEVSLIGLGGPSDLDNDGDSYSVADGDCDDGNAGIHPGATEICDGRDTNCDSVTPTDEADADGDSWLVCEADCDDTNNTRYPGAPEICDGLDNDCDGSANENADEDGDGYTICEDDCDDTEEDSFPGNPEVCDGVDNDCNRGVDDIDADGDGHSVCSATGDCDDEDPYAYPITASPTGNPAGLGTDADPVDSIATAIGLLDATCRTISLLPGTYPDVSEDWSGGDVTIGGQSGDAADVILQASKNARHFTQTGGTLVLRDLTLTGGHATEDGGAVSTTEGALTLSGVVATANTSDLDGGAVAVLSGSLELRRSCRFEGNQAGEDGGAVQVDASILDDRGTTYLLNLAPAGAGGALSINGGTVLVEDGTFRDNQASEGGGIAMLNSGDFVVQRNRIWSNEAANDGGGLAFRDVNDPTGTVRNNRIQDNTAAGAGGGAAFVGYGGALQLVNNTLTGNDAVGPGGGVAVRVSGSGGGIVVGANVLFENDGPSAVYTEPGSGAVVVFNTAFQQNSGDHFDGECGDGSGDPVDGTNAVRNPQLGGVSDDQDPENDDLALQAGSSEIDSGPPQPSFDDPDGSQNDRGFEGGPGATP